MCNYVYNRRKFRSQTSDNIDRWKAEQGRGREKRKIRRKKSRRERVRRKKMQMREKAGKSRFAVFFQRFVAPEGRKVGSPKRRVRSQLATGEIKNCICGAKHVSKSKCTKHTNVQNTPRSDHFWKLRCRKSARRCGGKHISKSKCTKHTMYRPFLEARRCGAKHISKAKCTKHTMYGPFLDVQMSFRVAGARDCGPCQKWAKGEGFVAFSTTTTPTLHYTPLHYTTLQLQLHLHYILLHYTPLDYTQLHSITLRYITLHYTTLHSTTLHYTMLHYTTLHYITLHYNYNYTFTTFYYTTLH